MKSLDTNILARLLLRDDEVQYRKAVALMSDGQDYDAPVTVVLELVWVLESYGVNRADIAQSLTGLLGLPNFKPSQGAAIAVATTLYRDGLDFADALHLTLSGDRERFVTFDDHLTKRAAKLGVRPEIQRI